MVPTTPSAVVISPSRVSAHHLPLGAWADCFSHVRSISAFSRVLNRPSCLSDRDYVDAREVSCAPSSEQGGSAQPLDSVQLDLRPLSRCRGGADLWSVVSSYRVGALVCGIFAQEAWRAQACRVPSIFGRMMGGGLLVAVVCEDEGDGREQDEGGDVEGAREAGNAD